MSQVARYASSRMLSQVPYGSQALTLAKGVQRYGPAALRNAKAAFSQLKKVANSRAIAAKSGPNFGRRKIPSRPVTVRPQRLTGVRAVKRRARKAKTNVYETRGNSIIHEVYGNTSDANCVYVGATSIVPTDVLKCVTAALIRALFKKGGVILNDPNRPLYEYIYGAHNSGAMSTHYYYQSINLIYEEYDNTTGLYTGQNIAKTILNSDTLKTLSEWAGFAAAFVATSSLAPNFENRRYLRLQWGFAPDTGGGTQTAQGDFPMVKASLNLQDCTIHLKGNVSLKIQNRSVNEAGDEDANDVDNVPIEGRQYDFSSACPRPATQEGNLDRIPQQTGVLLARAVDMSTSGFKAPPPPKFFVNCTRSQKVISPAGEMLTSHLSSIDNIKDFNKFLYRYASISQTGPSVTRHMGIGKHRMFAFEKVMRTASSELISVFYEASVKTQCYITEKSRSTAITDLYTDAFSL